MRKGFITCCIIISSIVGCSITFSPNTSYTTPAKPEFISTLKGVNLPSLEWKDLGEPELESAIDIINVWGANIIRLPLSQDRWFGRAPTQSDGGEAYRQRVAVLVERATKKRIYMLLDLHWSDMGEWGKNIGQHKMPDVNSKRFWEDAAPLFASNTYVMFDLYNEPHDVTWEVWKNGGKIAEGDQTYDAVGMDELLHCIRKTNSNTVIISGLNWSNDFRGITRGYALSDSNIVYGIHVYPWHHDWSSFSCIIGKYPVLFTEFGSEPDWRYESPQTWLPKFWAYAEYHNVGWIAWSFHPKLHPLIKSWDGVPTEFFGIPLCEQLEKAHAF